MMWIVSRSSGSLLESRVFPLFRARAREKERERERENEDPCVRIAGIPGRGESIPRVAEVGTKESIHPVAAT